jgi:hypothetical protein
MAEVSGGIGKKGSGWGAASGAGRKVKRGTRKQKSEPRARKGRKAAGGAACLKEAVDRKLKANSGKLANLLLEKAGACDLPTIRLVVSLAEQHEAEVKVTNPRPVYSQVLAWAAEPPWVGPPAKEEDSEAESQQADEPANVEEWPEGWEKKIIEAELLKQRQS